MKLHHLTGAAVALSLAALPSAAQLPNVTPFSFEVRGGLALPTGDLKDEGEADAGLTLSGTVTFHVAPAVGLYAGYSRSAFSAPDDVDYTDQGFAAGVRAEIPTPLIPIDPWIRAGLVRHTFSVDGLGEDDGDTDAEWGYEVGAGVGFAFTNKLSITPGVTYTTTSIDEVDLSHFRVDVGLRLRL